MMKAYIALMVVMQNPVPAIDPWDVPYQKQPPAFETIQLSVPYTNSLKCQEKAEQLNKAAGQPLPGLKGKIAGAFCSPRYIAPAKA